MVTSEMMQEMLQSKRPAFIFVCEGRVQLWTQEQGPGVVVATTRDAAEKIGQQLAENKGKPVSVAEIGATPGNTLAVQVALAVFDFGATGIYATDDGETVAYFPAPPKPATG